MCVREKNIAAWKNVEFQFDLGISKELRKKRKRGETWGLEISCLFTSSHLEINDHEYECKMQLPDCHLTFKLYTEKDFPFQTTWEEGKSVGGKR